MVRLPVLSAAPQRFVGTPERGPDVDERSAAAPLAPYVQRGAAMQMVKKEPTGDIFSCNNSLAVLKMTYKKFSLKCGFGS